MTSADFLRAAELIKQTPSLLFVEPDHTKANTLGSFAEVWFTRASRQTDPSPDLIALAKIVLRKADSGTLA